MFYLLVPYYKCSSVIMQSIYVCIYLFFVCLLFLQTLPLGLGDGQLFTWTDGLKRKDWHDYESIQKDAMRSGMLKLRANLSSLFILSPYVYFSFESAKKHS